MNQMVVLMQNLVQDVAKTDDIASIGRTLAVHDMRIGAVGPMMVQVDKKVGDERRGGAHPRENRGRPTPERKPRFDEDGTKQHLERWSP